MKAGIAKERTARLLRFPDWESRTLPDPAHGGTPERVGGKARKKLCASVTSLSRAVFNERATNESRLLYKKERH